VTHIEETGQSWRHEIFVRGPACFFKAQEIRKESGVFRLDFQVLPVHFNGKVNYRFDSRFTLWKLLNWATLHVDENFLEMFEKLVKNSCLLGSDFTRGENWTQFAFLGKQVLLMWIKFHVWEGFLSLFMFLSIQGIFWYVGLSLISFASWVRNFQYFSLSNSFFAILFIRKVEIVSLCCFFPLGCSSSGCFD